MRTSSPGPPLTRMRPPGSATKLPPQNSMPPLGGRPSWPDAIHRADEAAVGDGVAALDRLPRGVLLRAVLRLLGREPADRGRIEEDLARPRSAVSRAASGYHWSQQMSTPIRPNLRVPRRKAEVAGREVELLVVERVVGDVHLAVLAEERAVGVDDRGRVVVEPLGALLEERRDDHHAELARELRQRLGGRARDRLGEREVAVVLASGRSTGSGTAPGDRRARRPWRAPRERPRSALRRFSSGSTVQRLCTRPSVTDRAGVEFAMGQR